MCIRDRVSTQSTGIFRKRGMVRLLAVCLLLASAVVVVADGMGDLSTSVEPISLDVAVATSASAKAKAYSDSLSHLSIAELEGTDDGLGEGEDDEFFGGFRGLMTTGFFMCQRAPAWEEEELGEGEEWGFFGGFMSSGAFVMAAPARPWEE
eukprot:TRINITY_DN2082_c0_g1_i3.p1 TRINITY_DN2082_c0_g1~~TRINITY_DN2082_c0_g1_i3.p1  ORF type:complete len:151 (-),score=35.55 TRINITY_DN2082_c0_g1_i3:204-656(-)